MIDRSWKLRGTSQLRTRVLLVVLGLAVAIGAVGAPAALGEEIPRTSWGAPDLQGHWDFRSITPFQRPEQFKDQEFLTAEEVAAWEKRSAEGRAERANRPPGEGQSDVDVGYNAGFIDSGTTLSGTMRTSQIVDPPDGRLPEMTEDAKDRARARYDTWSGPPATPADRNSNVRCITGFNSGPPMTPGAYNNIMEIVQTADYVVIMNEMVNDHRVIPLDGSPHLPDHIRLWKGDSRGSWEGDTLVVSTTNFTDITAFRGTGRNLHLTERFTRVSEGGLLYEYTIDDPESYEKPWSTALEMKKTDDDIFEYACHEGNLAMGMMLRGARKQEAEGNVKDTWLATWYRGAAAALKEDGD